MMQRQQVPVLAGVIEGFYGKPWTEPERFLLFDWMQNWGLNTYLYAPKDDLKQRALWRELYSESEAAGLRKLIKCCTERGINFVFAISPGLDIRWASQSDTLCLQRRCEQLLELGCRNFALLFDDIPGQLGPDETQRFGSLAGAQVHVAHKSFSWIRERAPDGLCLFCPTAYCGRMAGRAVGGEDYLAHIGRELWPWIDVFWTGPEIISREITVAHIEEVTSVLRRKPLIWDNLHANDYDGRRFFCGPYSGRPPELRKHVRGILGNPNNEFPLNYVPLRTFAEFLHRTEKWDPRAAYLSAMGAWHEQFATVNEPISLEDLVLFGDCYYLPHSEGAEAEQLVESVENLLSLEPADYGERLAAFRSGAGRLRRVCAQVAALRDRQLFYALSRRTWELGEELDLLEKFFEHRSASSACVSDFHLPGTYRGGMVARLQKLLTQGPEGTFAPSASDLSMEPLTGNE